MGELLALMTLILFSINIIVTKVGSEKVNLNLGFLVAVMMNVVIAMILFAIQLLFRSTSFEWNYPAFFMFVLAGMFSIYLGRWLFFETIFKLGPAKASTFQVSNPLFTVIIAWIFLGERLAFIDTIAVGGVLVGLFLVSYVPNAFAGATRNWKNLIDPWSLMALLGSLSYAVGNVLRGTGVQSWNEPILGAFIGVSTGFILHLIFNTNLKTVVKELKEADRTGLLLFAIGGIMTISAQICVFAAMIYIPISIANLIALSTPLLVFPISYFFLKNQENITVYTLLGSVLVLVGISVILLY